MGQSIFMDMEHSKSAGAEAIGWNIPHTRHLVAHSLAVRRD